VLRKAVLPANPELAAAVNSEFHALQPPGIVSGRRQRWRGAAGRGAGRSQPRYRKGESDCKGPCLSF
ncbi:MAG: hypothetical protein VW771_03345, partial [Gammaproteobacteria bacterium]